MAARRRAFTISTLVLASALLPVIGAQAAPHVACTVSASASFSTPTFAGRRAGRLEVKFATTCGASVRAFYQHDSVGGAVSEFGGTVRGQQVSSSLTSKSASYCAYGWEQNTSRGWRQTTVRGHAC